MDAWSPGIARVLAHVRTTRGWMLREEAEEGGRWLARPLYKGGYACPVSSMVNLAAPLFATAAAAVSISAAESLAVVYAADGFGTFDPALRAALLEAAGLSEAEARA